MISVFLSRKIKKIEVYKLIKEQGKEVDFYE